MIAYVETNFILELAFLQEEHDPCGELLAFAEARLMALVLPAFSIGEAYEAWARRANRRTELHRRLSEEVQQLSRSTPYRQA